ncbi:MAG: energy transducer TonB [Pyrinomonadaceae bacterium]
MFHDLAAAQPPVVDRLLEVPDINGMAVSLIKPAFPETAVDVDADGTTVSLRVIVDENGNVTSAICSLMCHSMLKDAAELAAIQSKFKPMTKEERPVKYQGMLLYTFVVNRWIGFASQRR